MRSTGKQITYQGSYPIETIQLLKLARPGVQARLPAYPANQMDGLEACLAGRAGSRCQFFIFLTDNNAGIVYVQWAPEYLDTCLVTRPASLPPT